MDRGIIKWLPFNSCVSTQEIVADIVQEKAKIKMPTLSDDQLSKIEETIITAYNLHAGINIKYFYGGIVKNDKGIIKNIYRQEKKIYLNNKYIFFKQILSISID